MQETLHGHLTSISITDGIVLMDGTSSELQDLTNILYENARENGIEVSTEKSKILANSTTNTSADITMNGKKLEEVTSFKYMGATISKDGTSTAEVRIRIAMATEAIARLSRLWTCSYISFPTKYRLYKYLVVSILLYGC
ncbi:uncharacterized protein LOC127845354 [Dreissena polymorpha]|uniref:uncharacterized protein LOC127845354 n=1 Tax=Dreissena polymorpha TaxID=45954 RepID=UPI002264E324|nr:uncharacterized protein LOC127845354 [Dreissena polymorpha]